MQIKLENVRLSFPSLYTPTAYQDIGDKSYGATFLMENDSEALKKMQAAIATLTEGPVLKGKALPYDKVCLKDGADKDQAGYAGNHFVRAKSGTPVKLVKSAGNGIYTDVQEADGLLYAGAYVNAILEIYVQDNKFGKRINAILKGVMFSKHGDPFSGDVPVTVSDFASFGEPTAADDWAA